MMSNRNIIWGTYVTSSRVKAKESKKKQVKLIQNIISIYTQYTSYKSDILHFFPTVFKIQHVLCINTTVQSGLATFQVLNSHKYLLTIVLGIT